MLIFSLSFKGRKALFYTLQGWVKPQDLAMQNITIILQWKQYTYPTGKALDHFCNGNSINFKITNQTLVNKEKFSKRCMPHN